jgi:hypothetical protein
VAAAPAAPRGPAGLVGLLQPSEDADTADGASGGAHDDVIPELDVTDLLQRASYDLYSGFVIATSRAVPPADGSAGGGTTATGTAGLAPATAEQLPGAGASTALRNLLYALQWWVFGAFAAFVWWRWLVDDVLERRTSRPGGGGPLDRAG